MDPSIVKLLEEDEDESMHSGADVDAFQAALNRDIGGDVSTSQPSDPDSALVQGKDGNSTSSQPMAQWQNPGQDESTNFHSQQGLESARLQEQHLQQMELKQHGSVAENKQQQQNASSVSEELNRRPLQQKQSQDDHQQGQAEEKKPAQVSQTTGIQISDKKPVSTHEPERIQNQVGEYLKIQKMSNQQAIGPEQANNPMHRGKQVPFALLLPALVPHLDKDRAMQLHTLYSKLKKNEIVKDVFVRHMRDIVGDQMLRLAVNKMQSQMGGSQFQIQSQASARQQQLRMPSVSAAPTQFGDTHSFSQINQKGVNPPADPIHVPASSVHMQVGSSYPIKENSAKKSQELEHQSSSHGIHASQISSSTPSTANQEREHSSIPVQGLNKQQQQHLHFPQTSFTMYGSGSYHPYSGANVNPPGSSLKPYPHDSQMRQITHNQNVGSTPSGGASQAMNMMNAPKFERPNSMNDPGKVQGGSISHFTNNSTLQQSSVPWQASANKEQSSGPLSSLTYVKPEPIDQGINQPHKLHPSTSQGLSAAQVESGSTVPGTLKDEAFEKQSPRMGFPASTSIVPSNSVSSSTTTQLDPNVPLSSRVSSVTSPAGVNARTPPKKPSVGQKKPLEPPGSSPPQPSKKQKVAGAFSDQSIEQLNDVTAVSGVNLREEEEQLFSGPKEDSRVSEASRRVVQEEEERLILQKTPLQKKLAEIMIKCGLKNMSNDVERCLSLCVEERMRGLLFNLIRLSKQRVDAEKTRHRTIITSDIRQQIMIINRKAREEWEKKQAEVEKLRKNNEPEGDCGVDGDKEKDDGRGKSVKVNKEEDDKMRATAANVAARAAVGGDDMLSKWQLMAEQARQKREGGTDVASGSQAGKDVNRKPSSTSGRNMKDNQDAEKRSQTATGASGSSRKFGRSQAMVPQTKVARAISVKDMIAVLEREPQMSKSTLIYRLYEKVRSDAAAAE